MTSLCSLRGTSTALTRTGAMVVVFGLAFGPTGAAFAQADGPTTVLGVMGGDGKVSEVKVFGSEGEAPSAENIPVKVGISQSVDGDAATVNYSVENTSVSKKAVTYTDAAGKTATVDQDIALPLVAQLSVRVPASRTDVVAPGARITKLADGSSELVWSLVLFNPIGAPTADVSYTAKGTGDPLARLDVAVVNPNATPGLSATAQAANATVNGNGILGTIGNGANEGLIKLSEGVGKILAGLDKLEAGAIKLNAGLAKGGDGANQLAAGGAKAKEGSGKLAAGLGKLADGAGQIKDGTGKVAEGSGKLDVGAGKISDGLGKANEGGEKLAVGSGQLATGATAAAVGARQLADGLGLISGGLDLLSSAQGLPAALDGAKRLRFGVSHAPGTLGATDPGGLLEVLGSPTNPATVLGGLVAIRAGVGGLADTTAPTDKTAVGGLELLQRGYEGALDPANAKGLVKLKEGADFLGKTVPPAADLLNATCGYVERQHAATPTVETGTLDAGCDKLEPAVPFLKGAAPSVAGGVDGVIAGTQLALGGVTAIQDGLLRASGGLDKLVGGVTLIRGGVSSGSAEKPGLTEGLDALVAGLTRAVGGVGQLATGAKAASTGSLALAEGNGKIADGAGQIAAGNGALSDGLSQLYTGSQQLKAGTSALSTGAGKLDAGAGKLAAGANAAATGAGQLDAGLGKIAAGQQKLADGLPAAVDGSGKIADGLGQVVDGQTKVQDGLGQVRTKAVEVLRSQFAQGTTLARQQLAGLDAATALANATPGATTTTYVLTQDEDGIVANLASSSSDEGSSTGRNVALGAGGALLLLGGIAGGYLSGRRQTGV